MVLSNIRIMTLPFAITMALALVPVVPSPFSFWLALGAILLGPGWGIPRILFPRGVLTLPETLLIVILMSIFIDVAAFASLNAMGINLSIWVINIIILATTYASTIGAIIRDHSRRKAHISQADEPAWVSFALGMILGIVVVVGIGLVIQLYFLQ